ncbi:hypothetical protein RRG08_020720 [Elysia crispata]|uniref:Uncharacterized protein n=1 Tax=Elysia crispata TaxID=231223 RepID=A0AAE0Z2W6_9GAST|nr:hypothetical protein RRG08_020720 [Elysia crispata]
MYSPQHISCVTPKIFFCHSQIMLCAVPKIIITAVLQISIPSPRYHSPQHITCVTSKIFSRYSQIMLCAIAKIIITAVLQIHVPSPRDPFRYSPSNGSSLTILCAASRELLCKSQGYLLSYPRYPSRYLQDDPCVRTL